MPNYINRQDIINGYRLFLGRQPESEGAINSHLAQKHNLWSWVSLLAASEEARRRQLDRLSLAYMEQIDPLRIEVDISPDAIQLLLRHVTTAWSRLGDSDPYWSVLTDEKYRRDAISDAELDEFYRSGANELAVFEAVCARNGVLIDPNATILDLGCGVGRVGEHFARLYAGYVGVDISPPHLKLAEQRFHDRDISNAALLLLPDFLADGPSFDVFYSLITLQHCPPPIIFHLLRYCLGRLRPGGCAFFQIPCHLHDYEFRLADYLSKIGSGTGMEMHALPQSYAFRAFIECNIIPVEAISYPRIGPIGFSYAFFGYKPR